MVNTTTVFVVICEGDNCRRTIQINFKLVLLLLLQFIIMDVILLIFAYFSLGDMFLQNVEGRRKRKDTKR